MFFQTLTLGTEVLANCAVAAPAAKGTSALTCALPPGTGSAVLVAAANSVKTSARLPLVGYASPTVQRVGHIQCISTNDLELTNCPRAGEGYLTVIGTDFGNSNAVVLVGSAVCQPVFHDTSNPSNQLACLLPPGGSTQAAVTLIQSGGSVATVRPVLSYEACPAGTFSDGVACVACAIGRYASNLGSVQCLDCEAGSFQPAEGEATCLPCEYGRHKPSSGPEPCSACLAGTYTSSSTTLFVCAGCPAGRYSPSSSGTTCECARRASLATRPR